MNDKMLPRRALLKGALGLAAIPVVAAVGTAAAQAPGAKPAPGGASLPRLDPNSPQAKALAYVHDTKKVDPKAHPKHKPDQRCDNCSFWLAKPTDPWGGCSLFPGHSVAGPGWCKVWQKKR